MNKPGQDAFMEHLVAPVFVEESFLAHDESGDWRIPDEQRELLAKVLGMPMSKIAVFAWLAECRAEEVFEDLAFDPTINTFVGGAGA